MSYNDIASLVSVQKLLRIRPRQIFLYLELTTVKQVEKKEEGKASEVEKISWDLMSIRLGHNLMKRDHTYLQITK